MKVILRLEDNLRAAQLVQTEEPGAEGSGDLFQDRELEALAGPRSFLTGKAAELPGSRLLDDRFTSIQQAPDYRNRPMH